MRPRSRRRYRGASQEVAIGIFFSILGSGSAGNATLVETDRVRVLVEAGLSARATEARLASIGRRLDQIDAVLLTHEHQDHVQGLATLTTERRLSVVATPGTLKRVRKSLAPGTELIPLLPGAERAFADLRVAAFAVRHDAAEPVGFRFTSGEASLGYLTDLGSAGGAVRESLAGLTALVLESNHDEDLLRLGPYPARLKKRILSPYGHLSNEATGELLRTSDLSRLALLYLAHLSRTNNNPELARATALVALAERGARPALKLATQDQATPLEDASRAAGSEPAGACPAEGTAPVRPAPAQLRFSFEPASIRPFHEELHK